MATPNSLWMALFLLATLGVPPALAWAYEGHNFREKEFLGHWFAVGMVSNATWFREKKDILSMCVAVVAPAKPERRDGVLTLTTGFLRGDKYVTGTLVLSPTDTPGHYTYSSFYTGKTQDLWVDTDSRCALLYSLWGSGESTTHIAILYSHTEIPEEAVKDKFTAFAAAKGFSKDDILYLPNTGKCMEGNQ